MCVINSAYLNVTQLLRCLYLFLSLGWGGLSQVPCTVSTFRPSFFFLFFGFATLPCPNFKPVDSSARSVLPLKLSSQFFTSFLVLFISRIFFFLPFLLRLSVDISILFTYCFPDILHTCCWLFEPRSDSCFKSLS